MIDARLENLQIGEEQDFLYRLTNRIITPDNVEDIIVKYLNSDAGMHEMGFEKGKIESLVFAFDQLGRVYTIYPQMHRMGFGDTAARQEEVEDFFETVVTIHSEIMLQINYFNDNDAHYAPPKAIVHWSQEKFFTDIASGLGYFPRILKMNVTAHHQLLSL